MYIKRVCVLLLSAALASGMLSSCANNSGDNKPESKVTAPEGKENSDGNTGTNSEEKSNPDKITIMSNFRPQHNDFNQMTIVQQISQEANVEVEWELVADQAVAEKRNIIIATGDMPDAMIGLGYSDSNIMDNSVLFLPLNEHMDKMPNFNKLLEENPDEKSYLTFLDGNIYSFPRMIAEDGLRLCNKLYINKTWLDNLGLEVPTNYKEFEDALTAFKTQDPNQNGENDEIPFSFRLGDTGAYFNLWSMYGMFGRIDLPDHLINDNGTVVFTADKEEWKEATKWFAELYSKGLIDEESFTQDRSQLFAKGQIEPQILGATVAYNPINTLGVNNIKDYVYVLPLEGPNGDRTAYYAPKAVHERSYNLVAANSKNIDATLRFFDTCLSSTEYQMQVEYGLIGEQLVAMDNPKYDYEMVSTETMSRSEYRYKQAPGNLPVFLTSDITNRLYTSDWERFHNEIDETQEYLADVGIPDVLFLSEESTELSEIKTTIIDYIAQQQALWISGKADIDADWDNYISKLQAMKYDRYVEIYQNAIDRYFGK